MADAFLGKKKNPFFFKNYSIHFKIKQEGAFDLKEQKHNIRD